MIYLPLIIDNTLLSFLFGNGIGITSENFNIGISSGLLRIFIEQGAVFLIILVTLFAKLTIHNYWLMIYIFSCQFVLSTFFSPLFLFLICLSYACSYTKNK